MHSLGIVVTLLLTSSVGSAWRFLPRDNSTQVDAYNLLLCLTLVGLNSSTSIYTTEDRQLTLYTDNHNNTELSKNVGDCYWAFGEDVSFGYSRGYLEPGVDIYAGTIGELLDSYLEMPDWHTRTRSEPLNVSEQQREQSYKRCKRRKLGLDGCMCHSSQGETA